MDRYEIKLYDPLTIAGRRRPAGWQGIVTQSIVRKMKRAGAGVVIRKVPREEFFAEMTKDELAAECTLRGLSTSGKKDELLGRLVRPSRDNVEADAKTPDAAAPPKVEDDEEPAS